MSGHMYCFCSPLLASPVTHIIIRGNHRLGNETILSLSHFKNGEDCDQVKMNEALKALFETGYFQDVKIDQQENGQLLIQVQENPVLNRISFEGNEKLKDEGLLKDIQIRPRDVISKARIQEVQQRILEIYRRVGRYGARVIPKIIKLKENRINLVFEINENQSTFIRKIDFIGNKHFDSEKLEEEIFSKKAKWYLFFAIDDIYDPDRFDKDSQALTKFYHNHGFLDFKILSKTAELFPNKQDFILTFKIFEGLQYKVGKVNIRSAYKTVDLSKIRELIKIETNDEFSGKDLNDIIDKMTDELTRQGLSFFYIEAELNRVRSKKRVDLLFDIKKGERKYIERIEIKGNEQTRDYVIRREIALHEGDPLNQSKLKRSEQNIENLGFFKSVRIDQEQGSYLDKLVLVAHVEEQPVGDIGVSAGYSTLDGIIGNFKIIQRNFRGTGQTVSLDLTVAKRSQGIAVGIEEPYFLNKNLSASANVFSTRSSQVRSFKTQSTGFDVGLGYALSEHWFQNVSYGLKTEKISDVSYLYSPILQANKGNFLSSWVGHTIGFSNFDSKLYPRKGFKCSLSTTFSGLGGTVKYLKNELELKVYKSLSPKVILISKVNFGHLVGIGKTRLGKSQEDLTLFGTNNIRVSDTFMMGLQSFRGFAFGGIGPMDLPYNINDPEKIKLSHDPLGGTRYWIGSVEMTFPVGLPNEFGVRGALFSDFGSVWKAPSKGGTHTFERKRENNGVEEVEVITSKSCISDANKIRVSVGVGLAWDSPFGPIRLDYAIPIKKVKTDQTQRFLFGYSTKF
jgi:outer membrane protein insertion porin family